MNEHTEARHALKQAKRAAKQGDLIEAERWSKTAERLAQAGERLSNAPPPVADNDEEADEARRAELRRRLQAFIDADLEEQTWDGERAAYDDLCDKARANGAALPPPIRPNPAGPDEASREAYYRSILTDEE